MLLLEHLGGAEFLDRFPAATPEGAGAPRDARLATGALASLHAAFWGHAILTDPRLDWVGRIDRPEYAIFPDEVKKHFPSVRDKRCGGGWAGWSYALPADFLSQFDDIHACLWPLMQHYLTAEFSSKQRFPLYAALCHGDPRVENFFFHMTPGGRAAGLLDWQLLCKGSAPGDFSWLMTASFDTAECVRQAGPLLDHYVAELNARLAEARPPQEAVDRATYGEAVALQHVITLAKTIITLSGIEAKEGADGSHMLEVQNMIICNACALWEHWRCGDVWRAFRQTWGPPGKE